MFRGGVFRINGPGDIRRGSLQDQKAPKGVIGPGGDARLESQNWQRHATSFAYWHRAKGTKNGLESSDLNALSTCRLGDCFHIDRCGEQRQAGVVEHCSHSKWSLSWSTN
jgi:hypothetical protein